MRHVRALEEAMGELRAVRASIAFDGDIDSPAKLKRAALNYERATAKLRGFEHFRARWCSKPSAHS